MHMEINQTAKLRSEHETTSSKGQNDQVDIGLLRPWRIALVVEPVQVELIVDLMDTVTIGRRESEVHQGAFIDLRPFRAEAAGVSRQHLQLKLESDCVVAIDNKSVNGTRLNGRRLEPNRPYLLHHGDRLTLGAMDLHVKLLVNPLE